jgi:non-lysosomal glucosylceramidase
VLLALENYNYNGPEAKLSFAPHLKPQNFEGFFTTAKGWGNLVQHQAQGTQQNELQLKYGELRLKQLTVSLAEKMNAKNVLLYIDGKNIPAGWHADNGKIVVDGFDAMLYAGQGLKVVVKE